MRPPEIVGLHLYPSTLVHESRIEKTAHWLVQAGFFSRIYVVGISGADAPAARRKGSGVCFLRLRRGQADNRQPIVKALEFLTWFARVFAVARRTRPTCVNPHSLSALPVAVLIKFAFRARLVYDAHELETEVKTALGLRKTVMKIVERMLIRFADEVVVVSDFIADWYQTAYNIRRPLVVRNVPDDVLLRHSSGRFGLRGRLGLQDSARVAVYLGTVSPGRRVEWIIEQWRRTPANWHFVVVGSGLSLATCRELAATVPNVHFHPLVPAGDVVALAEEADIGFCMLDADCLSYKYSLPNKFFEYLKAGLPVVINELPEMAALIRRHDAGWVLPDVGDLGFLDRLEPDELQRKAAHAADLGESLSWGGEVENLRPAYERLLGRCGGSRASVAS